MSLSRVLWTIAVVGWSLLGPAVDRSTAPPAEKPRRDLLDLSTLPAPERFAFLVGRWTYEFEQGHGETVYRTGGAGNAILETLDPGYLGARRFAGSSIFLYDAAIGWRHNWIDALGHVLEGTGGMDEYEPSSFPAMIVQFSTGGTHFRHVWYDITEERFETDLYASADGKDYRLVRRMPYLRKAE